jgi:hypothetical protein
MSNVPETQLGQGPHALPKATRRQAAVRLLAIIVAAAEQVESNSWGPDVVGILRSQARLQALDFWMRNPDYLANELLTEYEAGQDETLLRTAGNILDSREPDLRRLPMIRYLFGAFEPVDDALSILRSHDLVRVHREGTPGQIREHLYLLTRAGHRAMAELAALDPALAWYKERAEVVTRIAGDLGGRTLKDRQYLNAEYAGAGMREVIESIEDRVRARYGKLMSNKP